MSKFKVGDMVIPERFERDDIFFVPEMEEFIGKPNCIKNIDDTPDETQYCVHNRWWPEGALKLAESGHKPFNLEAALRGEPVVTRDGRKAEEPHLFKTCKNGLPLSMIVDGAIHSFTKEGRFFTECDSHMDLFMAPQKKEYWVNVYRRSDGCIRTSTYTYSSECQAKDNKGGRECIGQVKIWEEMI